MANKKKNTKRVATVEEDELLEEEKEEELEEAKEDLNDEEETVDFQDLSIEDRLIKIENKENITLFLVLVTFLLCVILLFGVFSGSSNDRSDTSNYSSNGSNSSTNSSASETEGQQAYDTSAMKEISASDIKNESKNETIVMVVGRQNCGYCALYFPILIDVAKDYNITVRYIDFAKIVDFTVQNPYVKDSESYEILQSLTGDGEWKTFAEENIGGTPLTFIIKNNKVIGGVKGYSGDETEDSIRSAFDAAGLKK